MKKMTYCEALREATCNEMKRDPSVFVYGIGVPDHKRIFGSLDGILEEFGTDRCFDTPLSEDAMMGVGIGAAINGLRPINVHIRSDFVLLAMNQIVNMASNYHYVTGGKLSVPIVIRVILGRGWGQGSQHSKTMQSMFAHFPGLKVIMPTTASDAKGMLTSAIRDDNPVICLEHRWLYWQTGNVPEGEFSIPIGDCNKLREGKDITIVATSWMSVEALHAADILSRVGVEIEIINPRTICPLDDSLIIESCKKTKHCIVADDDWLNCGFSSEVSSRIFEQCFEDMLMPVKRVGFAAAPCPTARHLENEFYPNAKTLVRSVEKMLNLNPTDLSGENFYSHENRFKGPF